MRAGFRTARSPPVNAMTAANSGTVATSRPVSPDGQRLLGVPEQQERPGHLDRAEREHPADLARTRVAAPSGAARTGSRSSAPSSVRPATTDAGEYESTACLMKRYGMPHSTAIAAKRIQARASNR